VRPPDSTGTYTYKRDGAGATDPVLTDGSSAYTPGMSFRNSGPSTFQHGDRMGTVSVETNATQATTATRTYGVFGMPPSTTGSSVSPFRYAGSHGYQEDLDCGPSTCTEVEGSENGPRRTLYGADVDVPSKFAGTLHPAAGSLPRSERSDVNSRFTPIPSRSAGTIPPATASFARDTFAG